MRHQNIVGFLLGSLLLTVLAASRMALAFPGDWDPYLRYLNTQVTDVDVPDGAVYWRVAAGDAIPPPDEGFGDVKIWTRTIDENGASLTGIPIRIFRTSDGSTLASRTTPDESIMGGGNWLDFYNQLGPYSVEVTGSQPSEACRGLGLPANQHFSYTIVFQRAIKGVTPTFDQPTPLGKPPGLNLLVNPGAETGDLSGWPVHNGISLNADIYNNCGNRAGAYHFSFATYDSGGGSLGQTVTVTPGRTYTFGFWVSKKSVDPLLTLTARWSDNNGGSGTLYTMPGSETIFPIYGTRQDASFVPLGSQVTLTLSMSYSGTSHAAFHLDEFWLVEVLLPGPPVIEVSPQSLSREAIGERPVTGDVFTVRNAGGSMLDYSITDDADWLEVSPTGGDSTTETDVINVIYHNSALTAGEHHATITVTDPAADNSPQTVAVALRVRIPGDFDGDLDVDQEDFGQFQLCLTGVGIAQDDPACAAARLDGDVDVDQGDFELFEQCMTGADVPGTASCASAP